MSNIISKERLERLKQLKQLGMLNHFESLQYIEALEDENRRINEGYEAVQHYQNNLINKVQNGLDKYEELVKELTDTKAYNRKYQAQVTKLQGDIAELQFENQELIKSIDVGLVEANRTLRTRVAELVNLLKGVKRFENELLALSARNTQLEALFYNDADKIGFWGYLGMWLKGEKIKTNKVEILHITPYNLMSIFQSMRSLDTLTEEIRAGKLLPESLEDDQEEEADTPSLKALVEDMKSEPDESKED